MRSLGSCEGGALRLSLKGKVGVGEAKRAALGRVGLILQLSGCWGVLPGREGELSAFHIQGACFSFLRTAIQSHRPPRIEHLLCSTSPCTHPPTSSFSSIHRLRIHYSLVSPTYLSSPTSGERGLCFAQCCTPGQCFLPCSRCLAHAQLTDPLTHSPCACCSFSSSIHFPSYI